MFLPMKSSTVAESGRHQAQMKPEEPPLRPVSTTRLLPGFHHVDENTADLNSLPTTVSRLSFSCLILFSFNHCAAFFWTCLSRRRNSTFDNDFDRPRRPITTSPWIQQSNACSLISSLTRESKAPLSMTLQLDELFMCATDSNEA